MKNPDRKQPYVLKIVIWFVNRTFAALDCPAKKIPFLRRFGDYLDNNNDEINNGKQVARGVVLLFFSGVVAFLGGWSFGCRLLSISSFTLFATSFGTLLIIAGTLHPLQGSEPFYEKEDHGSWVHGWTLAAIGTGTAILGLVALTTTLADCSCA